MAATTAVEEVTAGPSRSSSPPPDVYTHLIVGTSLPLSILSASLSRLPSSRVLHIDENEYYGGENASLTLTQLQSFLQRKRKGNRTLSGSLRFPYFTQAEGKDGSTQEEASLPSSSSASGSDGLPATLAALDRHYSISVSPSLQPSVSPSLDVLIRSGVAKYATFRLLQRTAVWDSRSSSERSPLRPVPSSKEDIFKTPNTDLSLLEKRKIMKFLQACATLGAEEDDGDPDMSATSTLASLLENKYGLTGKLADAVMYGIALSPDGHTEPAGPALRRVSTHLRSTGRYGNSAYLVPQYGGAGELAQGYCRVAAVHGATFVLGKAINELSRSASDTDAAWKVRLHDVDEEFTVQQVIGPPEKLRLDASKASAITQGSVTSAKTLQGILVLDRGIRIPSAVPSNHSSDSVAPADDGDKEAPIETGLVVFPPGSLGEQVNAATVTALVLGEGTFCCPKGQYVVHITATLPSGEDATEAQASRIFEAAKEQMLNLAKDSDVEWKPDSSAEVSRVHRLPVPLVEVFWTEEDDRNEAVACSFSQPQSTESIASAPFGDQSPNSSTASRPSLTSLLDLCTAEAEALFYRLHGITDRRLFPDPNKKRRYDAAGKRIRHPAEYRGRAGAGPDLEDSDDDGEDQQRARDDLPDVVFFPKEVHDDEEDDDDS